MLKLENIKKEYDGFKVENINLEIDNGEYFVILGPTGTGKTIILEIIAGLIKEDKGTIFFKNKNITDYSPEERKVGMVYQDYMLFPHLNVKNNIIFGLKTSNNYGGNEIENKLQKMLNLFGIEKLLYRDVNTLSGGEKQRVALARALITSPDVLLLDEPLSAVDPSTREKLINELKKIHNKLGTTTIHVTHDFVEALALADKIAVMNNGQIEQKGETDEIFQKPASNFVAEFVGVKNIYKAKATDVENEVLIKGKNEDLKITIIDNIEDKANLTIRPEDIIISIETFSSSARNTFKGKVKKMKITINIVFYSYQSLKKVSK